MVDWKYKPLVTIQASHALTCLEYSPSKKWLAAGDICGNVTIFTAGGRLNHSISMSANIAITSIRWDHVKEKNLLCGLANGMVYIVRPVSGANMRSSMTFAISRSIRMAVLDPIFVRTRTTEWSLSPSIMMELESRLREAQKLPYGPLIVEVCPGFSVRGWISHRKGVDSVIPVVTIYDSPNWKIAKEVAIRHLSYTGCEILAVYRHHGFAYVLSIAYLVRCH